MVSFHRSAQVAAEEQPETEGVSLPSSSDRNNAAAFPRVNLMPDIVAAEARTHRAKMVLASAAVASVAVVGVLWVGAAGAVGESQDKLDAAQATTAQLATEQAKYSDVPKVQAQVTAAATQQYLALGGEVRWSFLLNNLALTLPAGTSLINFNGTVTDAPPNPAGDTKSTSSGSANQITSALGNPGIGTITYSGEAVGYPQVAAFLDSQGKQKTLLDPFVNSVTLPNDTTTKGLTFTSSATVTAAALSHRYDLKAGS